MSIHFQSCNGQLSVPCYRNLNLLAHAQLEELDIGSLCGGHGLCGGDRVKVETKTMLSPVTEAERNHLSESELAQGWRLACQCWPANDGDEIRIELPAK